MAQLGSWTVWLIRVLVLLLTLGLIIVTVLPAIQTSTWWIRYLDFPRLEFTIFMLLSALALIVLGPRRLGILAVVGLAACIAYNCSVLAAYSSLSGHQMIGALTCPNRNRLRLLEVNVQMTNRNADQLLAIVRQVKPDVA